MYENVYEATTMSVARNSLHPMDQKESSVAEERVPQHVETSRKHPKIKH